MPVLSGCFAEDFTGDELTLRNDGSLRKEEVLHRLSLNVCAYKPLGSSGLRVLETISHASSTAKNAREAQPQTLQLSVKRCLLAKNDAIEQLETFRLMLFAVHWLKDGQLRQNTRSQSKYVHFRLTDLRDNFISLHMYGSENELAKALKNWKLNVLWCIKDFHIHLKDDKTERVLTVSSPQNVLQIGPVGGVKRCMGQSLNGETCLHPIDISYHEKMCKKCENRSMKKELRARQSLKDLRTMGEKRRGALDPFYKHANAQSKPSESLNAETNNTTGSNVTDGCRKRARGGDNEEGDLYETKKAKSDEVCTIIELRRMCSALRTFVIKNVSNKNNYGDQLLQDIKNEVKRVAEPSAAKQEMSIEETIKDMNAKKTTGEILCQLSKSEYDLLMADLDACARHFNKSELAILIVNTKRLVQFRKQKQAQSNKAEKADNNASQRNANSYGLGRDTKFVASVKAPAHLQSKHPAHKNMSNTPFSNSQNINNNTIKSNNNSNTSSAFDNLLMLAQGKEPPKPSGPNPFVGCPSQNSTNKTRPHNNNSTLKGSSMINNTANLNGTDGGLFKGFKSRNDLQSAIQACLLKSKQAEQLAAE